MKLERYMLAVDKDGTTFYRYNPPADAVEAGIVQRKQLGTGYDEAVAYCNEQNKLLDEWRREHRYLKNLTEKSKMSDLVKSYMHSLDFDKLSKKAKYDYPYYLKRWYSSRTAGTTLINTRLADLSAPMCQRIYDEHAAHSKSLANHVLAVLVLLHVQVKLVIDAVDDKYDAEVSEAHGEPTYISQDHCLLLCTDALVEDG